MEPKKPSGGGLSKILMCEASPVKSCKRAIEFTWYYYIDPVSYSIVNYGYRHKA